MMAALASHNSLVEKAKWANFGSVIEQEGGSFCLIFSEAGDAVKFCLQVARTALNDHPDRGGDGASTRQW